MPGHGPFVRRTSAHSLLQERTMAPLLSLQITMAQSLILKRTMASFTWREEKCALSFVSFLWDSWFCFPHNLFLIEPFPALYKLKYVKVKINIPTREIVMFCENIFLC